MMKVKHVKKNNQNKVNKNVDGKNNWKKAIIR